MSENEPSRQEVLTSIASSAFYGNLGLFIGAGFSKAVFSETPHHHGPLSWGELLKAAASRMELDYDSISKEGMSYPQIASAICERHSDSQNISTAYQGTGKLLRK